MKRTLLLLALLTFTFGFSQTTVFSDNFDTETVNATTYANWTSLDVDGDGNFWEVADIEAYKVNSTAPNLPMNGMVADSDSWEGSALSPDNYLITTNPIDLTGASGLIELKFMVGTYQTNGNYIADQYAIYFSDSNDPATISGETPLYSGMLSDLMAADQSDGSASAVQQTIDLSSFAGTSKYLVFRHYNTTDENSVLIDEVVVEAAAVASVDANELTDFNYFYASNALTIRSNSSVFNSISIVDITGKTILSKNLHSSNETISMSNVSEGLYIAKVTTQDDKIKTFKFIVR